MNFVQQETWSSGSQILEIPESKMFTYPTHLIDSWQDDIMQICVPKLLLTKPEISYSCYQGSTSSLKYKRLKFARFYRRLKAPIKVEDTYLYDSRYDTDRNIAHLLANVIPFALTGKHKYSKVTIICRQKLSQMAKKSFETLNLSILCTDKDVEGKIFFVNESQRLTWKLADLSVYQDIKLKGYLKETPKRVFLARKNSRKLINEQEVEKYLNKLGFTKVYFEDLPLHEQWSITRNAEILVGTHGAALASLVFNNCSPKVIEIFHPGYIVNMYRGITHEVHGKWCGLIGKMPTKLIQRIDVEKKPRYYQSSPIMVDLSSLKIALEYLDIL
ncbi:MAG: DUF563 domain-containing protein [Crocosphaera sp.]